MAERVAKFPARPWSRDGNLCHNFCLACDSFFSSFQAFFSLLVSSFLRCPSLFPVSLPAWSSFVWLRSCSSYLFISSYVLFLNSFYLLCVIRIISFFSILFVFRLLFSSYFHVWPAGVVFSHRHVGASSAYLDSLSSMFF